jgi:BACON domain-containing protein
MLPSYRAPRHKMQRRFRFAIVLLCFLLLSTMEVSAADLSFTAVQGGANPSSQTLNITNTGRGQLSWSATDDAPWLTVTPTSGRTKKSDVIRVMVNISGLPANTYTGTITISTSGATTTSRQIQVSLTVAAPTPKISSSPTTLSFVGTEGGSNPTPQTLNITNSGLGTLNWTISDDAPWLTVTPSSGTTGTGPNTVTVSVNTGGLLANSYQATITVIDPKALNSPQQIPVTLAMTAPQSSQAILSWDANTEANLAGYKVYVGTTSGAYGAPVDVGNTTTFKVINLVKGKTYYFVVTAYDTAGNESDYSAEASKAVY